MDRQRPLIFLTVGTQLPFPRLLDGICRCSDRLTKAGFDLFGQVLQIPAWPLPFACATTLSKAEFDAYFDRAALVVSHCGMGTIITCQMAGKPAVLMPRRADLGEHRNDHQITTARAFRSYPGIEIVEHVDAVEEAMFDRVSRTTGDIVPIGPTADAAFIDRLRRIVDGDVERREYGGIGPVIADAGVERDAVK